MQREQLYHKTVDILVQAYFGDTLEHGNCRACAVGNLICANMYNGDERKWHNYFDRVKKTWNDVFMTGVYGQYIRVEEYKGSAKKQIDSTGYNIGELARIELAFESVKNTWSDDKMFNGLMAVIEALDIIHENKDEATTQSSKKKFNKEITNNTVLS